MSEKNQSPQTHRPTALELRMGVAGARRWMDNKRAEEAEERLNRTRPTDAEVLAKMLGLPS